MKRWAIIGCGRIAPKHVAAIRANGGKIVEVCDVDCEKAQDFAETYKIGRKGQRPGNACLTSRDIGESREIDAVSICTPSSLHPAIAIEMMSAGKSVVIEKPVAVTTADAHYLLAYSEIGPSVRSTVILQNRYNLAVKNLLDAVRQGALGKLLMISSAVRWYRPQEYYDGDDWHGTPREGGVLFNQACHALDLIDLVGHVKSVYARERTLARKVQCGDAVTSLVEYENGAQGAFECSVLSTPQNIECSITVIGTKGSVKIGGAAFNEIERWNVDYPFVSPGAEQRSVSDVYGSSHIAQYREFMNNGDYPSLSDAMRSFSISCAMRKSSEVGSWYDVDEYEDGIIAGSIE